MDVEKTTDAPTTSAAVIPSAKLTAKLTFPPEALLLPSTAVTTRSASEDTAVTAVPSTNARSLLEIVTISGVPEVGTKIVLTSALNAGVVTVTLTTKLARPGALKVRTVVPATTPRKVNGILPAAAADGDVAAITLGLLEVTDTSFRLAVAGVIVTLPVSAPGTANVNVVVVGIAVTTRSPLSVAGERPVIVTVSLTARP